MPRGKHLTLDEKAVIIAKRVMKKSFRTIAKEVNRDKGTICKVVNNASNENKTDNNLTTIRERVLQALNDKGLTDTVYAEKCIELLNCKRYQLQPDGSLDLVPDNANQAKTLAIVKDIMGLDAPKHDEITHKHYNMTPQEEEEIVIIRKHHNLNNDNKL